MKRIVTEVTATEDCRIELTEDDFDSWPPTPEQVRAKAIETFEDPQFGDRTGADYDVQFDLDDAELTDWLDRQLGRKEG